MGNPLLNRVGANAAPHGADISAILQGFNTFRQGFQGDPNLIIKNALSSGKVTQSQVDSAYNTARQILGMLR